MASLLAMRISSSQFFSAFPLQNHHHHHLALPTTLLRLSLSTQSQQQKEIPFIAQYLISSWGFSPDRALRICTDKRLAPIKTSSRVDSVVQFLKETGLSDARIKTAISFYPRILAYSVDKILKPKFNQLTAAGFTGEFLIELIRFNPYVFDSRNPVALLQFWRDFMGDSDAFLKLIQRNGLLIMRNIDTFVTPRFNLLKEYGFSHKQILKLLVQGGSRFLLFSLNALKQKFKETEELGFLRGSNKFLYGLLIVAGHNKETIKKKVQFLKKNYGWSEEEVRLAFVKFPYMLGLSEGRTMVAMNFLLKNAGLEPSYVASRPMLLSYSLEKTLVPRHHVLSILKAHRLKGYKLLTACVLSEKRFLERFIVPHEKDVPGLAQAYAAALSGKVPH